MKPEDIRFWQDRINKAETLQEERAKERKEILKLYVGEFFGKPTDNSGEVTEVNFVYEFVKVLVAAVYSKDPFIFVRARTASRYKFAETMEQVINYYWGELKLKGKVKKAIMDAVLSPPGFIEIGYLFLKEKKDRDEFTRKLEQEFPELKEVEKKQKMEEAGIFDETIKEDDVFANYRSSYDVLWPDGYHDIRDCPYLMIRFQTPYQDILANPMFKPCKNDLIGGNSISGSDKAHNYTWKTQDVKPLNMTPKNYEDVNITTYLVFDKRSQQRFIIAKNFDKDTLWENEWKYLIEGFTVYPLIFNDIPKTQDKANSYPLSDVVPMLPQLKELSKLSSAMMRHRKRAGTLILARKNMITPTQITSIQNGNDVDIIEVDHVTDDAIRGFTPPSLPPDFYRLREVVLEDLMRISGFHQLLSSGVSQVETATESENIRMGSQLRQSEKVDIIEDFTADIARGLAGLIWQFKRKEDIAEIIGEEVSEEMWPELPTRIDGSLDEYAARRIIQKEVMFQIEAGSTRPPKDESVERKQWMDLVATLQATFPGRLNQDIILKQILKKFDFKDVDSAIIGFDEEERQVAMQENQLLMQGIPIPVSPNQNHKIHLETHAQAMQMGSNPASDQHLLVHAKYEQELSPAVNPQKGDKKIATPSTNPDITRSGVPQNQDFVGGIVQSGTNKGK